MFLETQTGQARLDSLARTYRLLPTSLPSPSLLNSSGIIRFCRNIFKMVPFKALDDESRIDISFPFSVFYSNIKQIFTDAFVFTPFISSLSVCLSLTDRGSFFFIEIIYKRMKGQSHHFTLLRYCTDSIASSVSLCKIL